MTWPAEQRDDRVTLSGRGSYRGDGGRIPGKSGTGRAYQSGHAFFGAPRV